MTNFFEERDKAWDAYLGEIERNTQPSTDLSLVQFYRVSNGLDVDAQKYPNYTKYRFARIANTVTDFSASSREPISTATGLEERYDEFLTEACKAVISPVLTQTQKDEQESLEGELTTARRSLDSFELAVEKAWTAWAQLHGVQPGPESTEKRATWEEERRYDIQHSRLVKAIRDASSSLSTFHRKYITSEWDVLHKAMDAFENENYQFSLPPNPIYESNVKGWKRFHLQTIVMDFNEFMQNDSVRTLNISETTNLSDSRHSKWNASGGWSLGFVSLGGKGSGSSDEEKAQSAVKKIDIEFKRLEKYDIERGEWFQSGLFRLLRDKVTGFWGSGGRLGTFPQSIILARGLTINLHMEAHAKDILKTSTEGNGGFSIGPFSIGGGGGSSVSKSAIQDTEFGYSIKDGEKTVRQIGIVVERPNYSTATPKDLNQLINDRILALSL